MQNFGEYIHNPYSLAADAPVWDHWYAECSGSRTGTRAPSDSNRQYTRVQSDIPSLQAISYSCFPNFQLSIPDQYRVDQWLPVFHQQEKSGNMPNLTFIWLMTDHTTGTNVPDPVAQVADNDLATGRVVDAISHSKFWKSTAIFVVEDDTQNGVDHVDGHRGPAFVISPYSNPGVDDSYYTQLDMVKTVEQILGIPPMNQEDGAAEPIYDAFTQHANYAPYMLQPNEIPLTLGAPGYASALTASAASATPAERKAFRPQGVVPADMRSVYDAWMAWRSSRPPTTARCRAPTGRSLCCSTDSTGTRRTIGRSRIREIRRSTSRTRCPTEICPPPSSAITENCALGWDGSSGPVPTVTRRGSPVQPRMS